MWPYGTSVVPYKYYTNHWWWRAVAYKCILGVQYRTTAPSANNKLNSCEYGGKNDACVCYDSGDLLVKFLNWASSWCLHAFIVKAVTNSVSRPFHKFTILWLKANLHRSSLVRSCSRGLEVLAIWKTSLQWQTIDMQKRRRAVADGTKASLLTNIIRNPCEKPLNYR